MPAKKIIFDTDLGVDDAMALLFLHYSPRVDLLGICTGAGNAPVELTTRNCCYMKDRFEIAANVYRGAGAGLNGCNPLPPPTMIHGEDGLGDIDIPHCGSAPANVSAADYLVEEIMRQPGEITIVSVGRLTNLALAIERAPAIAGLVKEIVVMGGVIGRNGHIGNVSPVAEANIFGDPEAADKIFRSECPVTMVGLDVTHEIVMDEVYFERLKKTCGEAGKFIYQISRIYTAFHREWANLEGCYVHDSTAAIYAIAPELFTVEHGSLRVVTEGIAAGQTIFSPGQTNWFAQGWQRPDQQGLPLKQVCVGVNVPAVLEQYYQTLHAAAGCS
ncbi:MAG: nucleoside hydrolase [Gammaproteobacteria bacterium]|nr:nucleoside hydrolase [Gammaproteobacteria bacterium]